MKKILIILTLVILIIISIYLFKNEESEIIIQNPFRQIPIEESIDMCYQYSKDTPNGFADRAWLQMTITGNKVTGEYQNLPAETDSKVGKFIGTVGKMNPKISARIADVLWESEGEGMSVMEQLKIEFGEGSAVALFGEMVDNKEGVYVYKDATRLTAGFQMSQTSCDALKDKIFVEKYIREHIKTIAVEEPVLGGSWYVTSVSINRANKTGTMKYEDGHIQVSKNFSYIRNNNEVKINLIDDTNKVVACTMDAKQCPDGSYVGRTGPNCEFVCS